MITTLPGEGGDPSTGLNRKKKKKSSCTEMLTGCESAQHYGIEIVRSVNHLTQREDD